MQRDSFFIPLFPQGILFIEQTSLSLSLSWLQERERKETVASASRGSP